MTRPCARAPSALLRESHAAQFSCGVLAARRRPRRVARSDPEFIRLFLSAAEYAQCGQLGAGDAAVAVLNAERLRARIASGAIIAMALGRLSSPLVPLK
jgi:hypothetical protein